MTLSGLFGVLSIALVVGQLASVQHAALMELYNATGCSTTRCPRFAANRLCSSIASTNYLNCSGTDVVRLGLDSAYLTGTIPSAVGQLTALTYLNLGFNGLTGTIPSAVWQLVTLTALILNSNGLAGTISNAVGQLTALTFLSLRENAGLIGTIPITFSRLTNLVELGVDSTQLNGTFPPTTAPLSGNCWLDRTFLDCASKPKSSCSCSARLQGDDCESRRPISTGSTSVSAAGATTDGFSGACYMENDVWWEWTASCTGSATISACDFAPTNTRLAIYGVCPSTSTPTATTESGSEDCDDFGRCGGSGQEEATLAVVNGERIIIRLGTRDSADMATGILKISCSSATDLTTTIAAAVGSVVGLLLVGVIAIAVAQRKKKSKTLETATTLATREKETAPKSPTSTRVLFADLSSTTPTESESETTTIESESDSTLTESESSATEKKPAAKKGADFDSVESETDRASEPKVEHEYAEEVPKVEALPTIHKKRTFKKVKKSKKSKEEPEASVSVKSSDAPKEEPAAPVANSSGGTGGSGGGGGGTGSAIAAKQAWKIDAKHLTLGKVLGEGAFGVVSRGKWAGKDVAVKQISKKALGDAKAVRDFETEIGRMASMQVHPNVVVLYGVATLENGDLGAVMEYCAQGTLVRTLYGFDKRDWTEAELVEIAYDAACGVAHLHSLGIVHRDIAARNVLLAGKKDVVAKVADFGMSAEASAQSKEYAMAENGPLKWMAPEQLEKQRSSPASDVFAFGVLLYEIFARSAPWPGMNLFLAQSMVIDGKRMEIPEEVPAAAAQLMTACWAQEAKDRPTMKAVADTIRSMRADDSSASSDN